MPHTRSQTTAEAARAATHPYHRENNEDDGNDTSQAQPTVVRPAPCRHKPRNPTHRIGRDIIITSLYNTNDIHAPFIARYSTVYASQIPGGYDPTQFGRERLPPASPAPMSPVSNSPVPPLLHTIFREETQVPLSPPSPQPVAGTSKRKERVYDEPSREPTFTTFAAFASSDFWRRNTGATFTTFTTTSRWDQ